MQKTIARLPVIPPQILEGICKVLGDAITNSSLDYLLAQHKLSPQPPGTKWIRLFNAFIEYQNSFKCCNEILQFIKSSSQPARFINKETEFHDYQVAINKFLSLLGYQILDTGNLARTTIATTIAEVEAKVNRFKHKLESRNVHPEIFKYCRAELLVENYFHSVFEATKSIAERIRGITNLQTDGIALIDEAFSLSRPLIRINSLSNDTDTSEHRGLANFIKGLFSLIRNPTAHLPKIKFVIEEEEATDIIVAVSYVHKRLDKRIT